MLNVWAKTRPSLRSSDIYKTPRSSDKESEKSKQLFLNFRTLPHPPLKTMLKVGGIKINIVLGM